MNDFQRISVILQITHNTFGKFKGWSMSYIYNIHAICNIVLYFSL